MRSTSESPSEVPKYTEGIPLCAAPHQCGNTHKPAVRLSLRIAIAQRAVVLLLCTTTLPLRNGAWNSLCALQHCVGVAGSGPPFVCCCVAHGATANPACRADGELCAAPSLQYSTANEQLAVVLLHHGAMLLLGSGQCSSCSTAHTFGKQQAGVLLRYINTLQGASGSGTPARHNHMPWDRCDVNLLRSTATTLRINGHCNSLNTRPHC